MWACLGCPGGTASAAAQGLSAARPPVVPPSPLLGGRGRALQVTAIVTSFSTEGAGRHPHQPGQKPEGVPREETSTLTQLTFSEHRLGPHATWPPLLSPQPARWLPLCPQFAGEGPKTGEDVASATLFHATSRVPAPPGASASRPGTVSKMELSVGEPVRRARLLGGGGRGNAFVGSALCSLELELSQRTPSCSSARPAALAPSGCLLPVWAEGVASCARTGPEAARGRESGGRQLVPTAAAARAPGPSVFVWGIAVEGFIGRKLFKDLKL